ncbi:hypothetical protein KIN20_003124 [Parelaphostrongylus tenuis]|uniref:Uncharacterized protein n=1 Tax=Parelaphostrongylus tenuis TaxID=148309 RepID=A0AAD5QE16_PARTN|nr:hypothetical protein KIN20_003124 [Parelaphostrongylus tenuis]
MNAAAADVTDDVDRAIEFILKRLNENCTELTTLQISKDLGIAHQAVVGAVKSLLTHDEIISTEDASEKNVKLTDEGNEMMLDGSAEYRVYKLVGTDGALQAEIMKFPFGKVGINKALAAGWISIDKSDGAIRLLRKSANVVDTVRAQLEALNIGAAVDEKLLAELKKRKLVSEVITKYLIVKKGSKFTTSISKPEVDLTPEMIATGSWKNKTFKQYNFDSLGVQPACGHLHPLMKVRSEFREIFFSMGFSEMPTNRYVESSFWNFDALFQPQQHPARDAHDTFFVSDPALSTEFPKEYLERVKAVHSKGGYGSIGYKYDWKIEEAQKNVLRTHTTAVSARQLYKLAQEGFRPTKMFSIDRVFRNETLDANSPS